MERISSSRFVSMRECENMIVFEISVPSVEHFNTNAVSGDCSEATIDSVINKLGADSAALQAVMVPHSSTLSENPIWIGLELRGRPLEHGKISLLKLYPLLKRRIHHHRRRHVDNNFPSHAEQQSHQEYIYWFCHALDEGRTVTSFSNIFFLNIICFFYCHIFLSGCFTLAESLPGLCFHDAYFTRVLFDFVIHHSLLKQGYVDRSLIQWVEHNQRLSTGFRFTFGASTNLIARNLDFEGLHRI